MSKLVGGAAATGKRGVSELKRALAVLNFQLRHWAWGISIYWLVIASLTALRAWQVYQIRGDLETSGMAEGGIVVGGGIVSAGWVLFFLGLTGFTTGFRFMQGLSVSRRTVFAGHLLALVSVAVVIVVVELAAAAFMRDHLLLPVAGLFEHYYGFRPSPLLEFLWRAALCMLLALLAWFISLLYHRGSATQRALLQISPFLIFGWVISTSSGMTVFSAARRAWTWFFGLAGLSPDPQAAMANFTLTAVIMAGLCYLLVRRASVR